jgi:hypothetical protein
MNKEQEQYFDRKILGKIEDAEVDAPFSWAEMEGQLDKRKRNGGWWLRGFLFSDVIILLASSLLIWQWSSVVSPVGVDKDVASVQVQLPELVVLDKLDGSDETMNNGNAGSESAEIATTTSATTTATTRSATSNSTLSASAKTTETTETKVASEVTSLSSLAARSSVLSRKKSGRNTTMKSSTAEGINATSARESDGEVAVVENATDNLNTNSTSMLVPESSTPSSVVNKTAEVVSKSSVVKQIISESSSANEWQLMSVLSGMVELSPLELSLLVADKKLPVDREDELSPALISVYGIGGFEKVKYSTLVPKGEELNFQHQWHGGTGFGLTFGYMTSNNWSVHTGLELIRREVEFEWISPAKRQDFYLDSTYVQIIPPVGPPYYVWQLDTIYTTVSYVDSLNYRASVSVVTVPILVQYAKPFGAITIAPYTGIEWNSRTTTKLIREREGESPAARNEGNLKETRNYLSLRAGCKVFLRLGANADLFTGVDFRYMLPLNRDKFNGVSGSLQLGVQLHR